ncbi:MAG: hypothetical protein IPL33_21105 [Sphingobacteriales bacterium]|nr:hypothetical protein [Sphingobacteriales bacterium]
MRWRVLLHAQQCEAHIANKRYDLKSLQVVEISLHEKTKYWHFYHDEYVIDGKLYDVVASDYHS